MKCSFPFCQNQANIGNEFCDFHHLPTSPHPPSPYSPSSSPIKCMIRDCLNPPMQNDVVCSQHRHRIEQLKSPPASLPSTHLPSNHPFPTCPICDPVAKQRLIKKQIFITEDITTSALASKDIVQFEGAQFVQRCRHRLSFHRACFVKWQEQLELLRLNPMQCPICVQSAGLRDHGHDLSA